MEGGAQICPACFRVIALQAVRCPRCGADLAKLSQRDYAEKLILALEHPLDDVRMRAILALAWRRDAGAAQALVDCALRHPRDVVQALAVVGSLARLLPREPANLALARLAEAHPAHAIQVAARQMVERTSSEEPHGSDRS